MEQKKQGRARVKVAVFCVLAVQGIGLLALLMQGCRREDKDAQSMAEVSNTNAPSVPGFESTGPVIADSNAAPATAMAPSNAIPPVAVDPGSTAVASDYLVKSGDNFTTIGKSFHVTAKAIMEANPGIEPTKLRAGQKLHIPAPAAPTAPAIQTPNAVAQTDAAGAEGTYKVKTGDTLSKIATSHHTTVRALRAANNLRTDSIKVGQMLKIPTSGSGGTTVATGQANPAI